jgi:monovalent cation:H+ antiporter, CPA1 family
MALDLPQLGVLLLVSALVAMLTRRLNMPYTVGLVLAGMGLFFGHVHLQWHLSKDLIFNFFLPPLVFEAALFISWKEFKENLPVVALLATAGVAIAAAATAIGMHYALAWDWASASLFGALIAATDPVSVIATFKDAGVRGRVRLLLEAESLINDGTAAVAFVTVLAVLAGNHQSALSIGSSLLLMIVGSPIIGASVAGLCMLLAGRTPDHLVEITFTILAAYGSFFLAEHFQFSGVVAALSAGLVVGNLRESVFVTDIGRHALEAFWEYVAFIANSLIFLLIGAQEAQQHFIGDWVLVIATIALVTLGRALSIYPLCAIFSRSRYAVENRHQHALFWGGLRGALALALALALPDNLPQRDAVITLTFAMVAFSVFVQGLTITPLLRRLRLLGNEERPDR